MHRFIAFVLFGALLSAQGTLEDYKRADGLRDQATGLALNVPDSANWIGTSNRFWYRRSVKGGHEFVAVDASTLAKTPVFDHARLAAALSQASTEKYTALKLPFTTFTTDDKLESITVAIGESRWDVNLSDYKPVLRGPVGGFPRRAGVPATNNRPQPPESMQSPDGKWEARIVNFNLHIKPVGKGQLSALSSDGSEGNYYDARSILWSPDSQHIAVFRIVPGYHRKIEYIESSPESQLQPKFYSLEYAKPGDSLDTQHPVLFNVVNKTAMQIDNTLFPNPYLLSRMNWWKDSRGFTFEYNQRGHQLYRVIEVSAANGKARVMINEAPETFFCYSGKMSRTALDDGKEIIWMSERDGWNHLYLFDGATGKVKNQITKGNWVVRGVEHVDVPRRQIYFRASGMYSGKDPYFVHYYRINFDGTGLVALTDADANHAVKFSFDFKQYVDTYSRIDMAPVSVLRSVAEPKKLQEIERANIEGLVNSGWHAPEVFTSLARDGKTDIWGIILRPSNFDPNKKYPVIEYIYAGPQDSFVPKSFSPYLNMQALAELGFIVVQVDGMGTSNRSKVFHDYCWRNLADAGFPDRILWHKAIAAKYPYYDITKVGIYGHSAGGQNALGALLFHPEFYKVAVSSCGCHDNRMDKIWWNEQWMGWPLGEHYVACSNAENASKLKGKLLLSVGELDNNVDPASTMQVVNSLIKANKVFDFIMLPGQGHSTGGVYGDRKRYDFFVHHLLGVEPPDWNTVEKAPAL